MIDSLRPFLSRLIAPFVAAGTGWLFHRTGIVVDDATVTSAIVLGAYGIAHKVLDKKLNPGDTASSHLAVESKAEAYALKRGR